MVKMEGGNTGAVAPNCRYGKSQWKSWMHFCSGCAESREPNDAPKINFVSYMDKQVITVK